MSFIDEKIRIHNEQIKQYSLSEMESSIAKVIVEDAKMNIESAINAGKSEAVFVYNWDRDGYFDIGYCLYPAEKYLYNEHGGVYSLSQCFQSPPSRIQRKIVYEPGIVSAIKRDEKKLNLAAIEKMVYEEVIELGVKYAEVYVTYIDSYIDRVKKKQFFREYYEERRIGVGKYKVYCRMSW